MVTMLSRPTTSGTSMRRRSGAVLLISALFTVTGCGGPADDTSGADVDGQTGPSVPSPLTMVDPVEAVDVLALDGLRVIDVRTPTEFAEGHITGAELIDISGADFAERIASLERDATYFVYCRSDNRSGVATQMMLEMGFTSVYELRGGTVAWQQAGLPLDPG